MLFRIPVVASDGAKATVTFQVDDHRKWALPYVTNDIADRLRVDRSQILTVLADWSHEQLVAHLATFSSDDLKPPAYRR